MASPGPLTPEELQALIKELTDVAANYSATPDLNGYISRVQVIEKAKKVAQSLITPDQLPNYHGLNMAELIAIRTFIKLKVFEAIPATGSISLQDLAKATGAQESLLERMARILVATGFLDQTLPDGGDYKHTKFSLSYITSTPGPGPGKLFLAMYDEWFKNMHNFDDYLVARNQLAHATEPDNPTHNPYTWTHGQDGVPVWAIMSQDPEKFATFQVAMSGLDAAIPVIGHFDFSVLANSADDSRTQLVDVGGGHGAVLRQILAAHPALDPHRCVLQDRPEVIALAQAGNALPAGVTLTAHDFTSAQPVQGAKAYFMRMILHDYADGECGSILGRLAAAMARDSRLLVCEMVIPARVGEADFPAAVLDQCVLAMGGKERTEEGFRKLFEGVGLELVRVWRVPGVPGACVEGRLKA